MRQAAISPTIDSDALMPAPSLPKHTGDPNLLDGEQSMRWQRSLCKLKGICVRNLATLNSAAPDPTIPKRGDLHDRPDRPAASDCLDRRERNSLVKRGCSSERRNAARQA